MWDKYKKKCIGNKIKNNIKCNKNTNVFINRQKNAALYLKIDC